MGATRASLERLLQFVLAGLMILATMLFSVGHRAPWLILCVAISAAAAILLVDVKGWFRLSRNWANLLAVTSVAIWFAASRVVDGEMQLVAVTYVLLVL